MFVMIAAINPLVPDGYRIKTPLIFDAKLVKADFLSLVF